jgi:acyl-coenzyme A thioesterase PaaI-like protein
MPKSLPPWLTRLMFNLWPCYRGTGGRVAYVSRDCREIRIRLPLSWRTYNYVGTIYGGSMYAAIDPIYMYMLIQNLGPDYVVWDKAATIHFKKPGRTTLYARFVLDEAELEAIRQALVHQPAIDRVYTIELVDEGGAAHAIIEKTIYIRRKQPESP